MSLTQTLRTSTISDRELELEAAIACLQSINATDSDQELRQLLTKLRDLLFPRKYRVRIQLEEDGRKKRSTADASYWNFDSGELVMFYEAVASPAVSEAPLMAVAPNTPSLPPGERVSSVGTTGEVSNQSVDQTAIDQCVQALQEAEKLGKRFIAYKWFRDLVLPGLSYVWVQDEERRQQVLSAAVENGRVTLQKIPNPRHPMFPTTTLSVNRTIAGMKMESRFHPVPVVGEPVSATLLRDRG